MKPYGVIIYMKPKGVILIGGKKLKEKNQGVVPDIKKTVVFDAPIQRVWEAVSTSEGIEQWFMPNDFQPVEGHEFYILSQFEKSKCKVLHISPPYKLSFSWGEFGWVVSFNLTEQAGKTEFTLTHSGWGESDELIPTTSRKHSNTRHTMNKGWDSLVEDSLRKVVES